MDYLTKSTYEVDFLCYQTKSYQTYTKKSVIFQTELYICIRTIRIDYENSITIFILSFPTQLKKIIKCPSLKLIRKHFSNLILQFL